MCWFSKRWHWIRALTKVGDDCFGCSGERRRGMTGNVSWEEVKNEESLQGVKHGIWILIIRWSLFEEYLWFLFAYGVTWIMVIFQPRKPYCFVCSCGFSWASCWTCTAKFCLSVWKSKWKNEWVWRINLAGSCTEASEEVLQRVVLGYSGGDLDPWVGPSKAY